MLLITGFADVQSNQVPLLDKTFDEQMGVKVNWRAFSNGNEMTAAIISGEVHLVAL